MHDRTDLGRLQFWTMEEAVIRNRGKPLSVALARWMFSPVRGVPDNAVVVWIRPGASLIGSCCEAQWLAQSIGRPVAFYFDRVPAWAEPDEREERAYGRFYQFRADNYLLPSRSSLC